jgi:amicyanin
MSKKLLIVPALLMMLAAGCTNSTPKDQNTNVDAMNTSSQSNTDANPQSTNTVEIKDYKFGPQNITVKKGTTVTWTNRDDAKHNVVAQGENAANGPKSELLAKDQTYTYTFNTAGTFNYRCEPHPYMTGMVTVTE